MTNNDIIKRIRYTFDYSDQTMIDLFKLGGAEVTREQVSNWLKKEEDTDYTNLVDKMLATFLNGLIIKNRGAKDGETPMPEKNLNNNIIFRKFKIAFNLKDEDILHILTLVNFHFGKHELSAFFRKPGHDKYRECKDQILRNFLHGLQIKHKPA
jgi:uncharacterized protein YehS (DUF1456 family)